MSVSSIYFYNTLLYICVLFIRVLLFTCILTYLLPLAVIHFFLSLLHDQLFLH